MIPVDEIRESRFVEGNNPLTQSLDPVLVDIHTDDFVPKSAKQAPLTRPTYPLPTIQIVSTYNSLYDCGSTHTNRTPQIPKNALYHAVEAPRRYSQY